MLPKICREAAACALILGFGHTAIAGEFRTLYQFQGVPDGANPTAYLTAGSNGQLYGVTYAGGQRGDHRAEGNGTLFSIDPNTGEENTLFSFQPTSRRPLAQPITNLVEVGGGLWGYTANGFFYRFDESTKSINVVRTIPGGTSPATSFGLTLHDGLIYGATPASPGNGGSLLSMNPTTGYLRVIYVFKPYGLIDAFDAASTPVFIGDLLYSVSEFGGTSENGSLFRMHVGPAAYDTILYSFTGGLDGKSPLGTIVLDGTTIYGTAEECDSSCYGTVFAFDIPTRQLKVLTQLAEPSAGEYPNGLVMLDHALYGTTIDGGASGMGVLFSVDPATGKETVLHDFTGGSDGAAPQGLLVQNGTIFGVAYNGGEVSKFGGGGTVFAYKP